MLALSDAEVEEAQYAPAVQALRAYRGQARDAFDAWRRQGSPVAAGCSWERFALALHLVQSRTIRLAVTGCRVMIPAVDCLNHGGSAGACGTLALGSSSWAVGGERTINFVTTRDVAAGEQVLWTYGDRSSEDFFAYHGFVLPGNPQEEVQLWGSVAELAAWFHKRYSIGTPSALAWSLAKAEAGAQEAAQRAAQLAAIACASPRVPGTCSCLVAPLWLPGAPERGDFRDTRGGAQLEGWLAALKRAGPLVERRLAALRLHLPEWGTADCAASPPELVACADGRCDVRIGAALVYLYVTSQSRVDYAAKLVSLRARQLLAGFPTTADEDEDALGAGRVAGALREVVAFRLAKKRALEQLAILGGEDSDDELPDEYD
ncbi:MAG: hypothetical protein J3K34DRAFT_429986 [Monoraphidium minutum]|nr:MAG: hypothetical protein J3K34DRAFT_429986 [Monoraphidium minutum]